MNNFLVINLNNVKGIQLYSYDSIDILIAYLFFIQNRLIIFVKPKSKAMAREYDHLH